MGYCSTGIATCAVGLNYRSLHNVNILEDTFEVGYFQGSAGHNVVDPKPVMPLWGPTLSNSNSYKALGHLYHTQF